MLTLFEKRALSLLFGPKWDEVREEWRKLLNYRTSMRIGHSFTNYHQGGQTEEDERNVG